MSVPPASSRRRGRPRGKLDRSTVLAAASRLVAREGLEQLTLARLARHLRVSPTAVRWHVRGREELLDGLVTLAARNEPPAPGAPSHWRTQIVDLLSWLRRELLAHRELLREPSSWTLLFLAFVKVAVRVHMVLETAGFQGEALKNANRSLYGHTFAFVLHENLISAHPTSGDGEALEHALKLLSADEIALLSKVFAQPSLPDNPDLFRYGIETLLDGLEEHASASRS